MPALNAVNFGRTTLNQSGGIAAGAISAVFATVSNMPAVPFKFRIDEEIFIASALNGSTYTIQGAQEGSVAAAHANGSAIGVVFTAEMFLACYPSGSDVEADGSGLQMGKYDFNYDVTASAPGTITLPANPIPYKDYTIKDGGGNFSTNPQTIAPLGVIMDIDNMAYTFFQNSAGDWRIK